MDNHKPAWVSALSQFRDGSGAQPDLSDPGDVGAFLPMLEKEIRSRMEADLAVKFSAAADRINSLSA